MKAASSNVVNEQKPHFSCTAPPLPLECTTSMCFDNASSLVAANGHKPQKNRRTVSLRVGTYGLMDLRAVSFAFGMVSGFTSVTHGIILWIDLRAVTFTFGTDRVFARGEESVLTVVGLCEGEGDSL